MSLFEKFLEAFSAKDLRSRVAFVIAMGVGACVLILVVGYLFMTTVYTIEVAGAGRWADEPDTVNVALHKGDIDRLPTEASIEVEFGAKDGGKFRMTAEIVAIDPAEDVVQLKIPEAPEGLKGLKAFDTNLIIAQKPYWQYLWKGE